MRISDERWNQAQIAERRFHRDSKEVAIEKYKDSYRQYFEWLGIDKDLNKKYVIEIGCADVPALMFCTNYNHSIIIEPMPSSVLRELIDDLPICLYDKPVEDLILTGVSEGNRADELWLFNVLQHVIDIEAFVDKCKSWSKVIRFFEPVDQPISDCHPHAPTQADFKRWFGDSAKLYEGNPKAVNFHTAVCCFGVWRSDI